MPTAVVSWSDEVDEILAGDVTAAAAYPTPAGGAVVTGVAPCGLRDRERGTVTFTTSLGFSRKLERIVADPRVALAFHARDHGFARSPRFVLVQGRASVDLRPSRERLEGMVPDAERFMGEVRRGPVWDWLLREYYQERVFVDVAVERVVVWPDLAASGDPEVLGAARPGPPPSQRPPRHGAGPRVDVEATARRMDALPHRVLAYRGADGLPVVVPITLAGHDETGVRLVAAPGLVPPGARRAGLLAHRYRPHLVGLATRTHTGWLDVAHDGSASYAPHTCRGFAAPPQKTALLVGNGLLAKYGMWQARRAGVLERLEALAAAP